MRGRKCSWQRSRDSRAAHEEDHIGADIHLQPKEAPTPEHIEVPRRKIQPVVIEYIIHGTEFDQMYIYKDISDAIRNVHVKEVIYKWIEKDLKQYIMQEDEICTVLNQLLNHKKKLFLIT